MLIIKIPAPLPHPSFLPHPRALPLLHSSAFLMPSDASCGFNASSGRAAACTVEGELGRPRASPGPDGSKAACLILFNSRMPLIILFVWLGFASKNLLAALRASKEHCRDGWWHRMVRVISFGEEEVWAKCNEWASEQLMRREASSRVPLARLHWLPRWLVSQGSPSAIALFFVENVV